MGKEPNFDPRHTAKRTILRIIGPLLLIAGIGLVIIGFLAFFALANFAGLGGAVVGMVVFMLGGILSIVGFLSTSLGYMGSVARYESAEITPVATDTFNYVADETSGGVKTMAHAVGEGIGLVGPEKVACPKCGDENRSGATFCNSCGAPLERKCPSCYASNDPDAKFCDKCGSELA